MARTLLQLVQQAASEIGIPEPQFLFNNTAAQEKQIIALANREGKEFSGVANKNGGWQALHKEYTFNTQVVNTTGDTIADSNIISNIPSTSGIEPGTWSIGMNGFPANCIVQSVDGPNQVTMSSKSTETQVGQQVIFGKIAYDIPTDLEYYLDKTFWDNRYKWALVGPITAQEKQILRYGVVASGPRNKFYIRDNKMWIDPVPQQEQLIAYDYYTKNWCMSVDGTPQSRWGADTDTYLLDEDCFIEGLKWRFLRAKGMDYAEEYNTYVDDVNRNISRDGGTQDLDLGGVGYAVQFLNGYNVPETGFGNK